VNTVMNLRFRKWLGISWLAERLVVSQEGLCSMELVSYEVIRRHKLFVLKQSTVWFKAYGDDILDIFYSRDDYSLN
jgi:hypothetical protein